VNEIDKLTYKSTVYKTDLSMSQTVCILMSSNKYDSQMKPRSIILLLLCCVLLSTVKAQDSTSPISIDDILSLKKY
jgi:hypothetical protein